MKLRALAWFVLFAILLGMASCGGDAALPTETATMVQIATPTEAAIETKPTATAVPTKPAPTAAPVEVEKISFRSDPFKLVGDLQVPGTAGKYPVIVMVHGDGRIDRYDSGKYRPIMERFLHAGYAVFSWDKPGTGESTGELDNDSDKLSQRAAILVSAIERLKEHPAIDPDRIGVWGISQAGYVIPLALRVTDDIAFMIVVSGPAMDSYDQGAYLLGQLAFCAGASEEEARLIEQQTKKVQKAMTYQEYLEIAVALHESPILIELGILRGIVPEDKWSPEDRSRLSFFNPIEVIEQTTIPVLAFFGKRDRQVDPFQGEQAYREALEKVGNQHSRVMLIPGVDHNLVYAETGCISERDGRPRREWLNYAPEYLQTMEEWLVQLPTPLPTPSGSGGGVISFVSTRQGNWDIYLMNADGTDVRRLTNHNARDSWPTWSPDGKRMAFMSERSGGWKVFVMDIGIGEDSVQLLTPNGTNWEPAWSPDGTRIAFGSQRDGNSELYVMNADGSGQRRLTNHNLVDGYPCWSPDSTQIAFVSNRDGDYEVYVINEDGTNLRQLTDNDADEWVPAWSPDGSRIAFASDRGGNLDIYVMAVPDGTDAGGIDLRQLTDSQVDDLRPAWSPDGTTIAFHREEAGESEIYLINADGTDERQLTRSPGEDRDPSWWPAAGGTASTPPAVTAVELPRGSAPTIDGVLSADEWAEAYRAEITGGGEVFLMQDGSYLYVGIRAEKDVLGSICVLRGNEVAVLHASAALGTAVYERVDSAWQRVREFSWSCRDTSDSTSAQRARSEFLEREGWLASITGRGNLEEMEYQIVMPDGGLYLAVVYLQGPDFDTVFGWPGGLGDSCYDLRLAQGYTPESLQFAPDTWATVVTGTKE